MVDEERLADRSAVEAEIAHADGDVPRLLNRQRPRVHRAAGHERVGQERELLVAREVGRRIRFENELHQPLERHHADRVRRSWSEQSARLPRRNSGLRHHLGDHIERSGQLDVAYGRVGAILGRCLFDGCCHRLVQIAEVRDGDWIRLRRRTATLRLPRQAEKGARVFSRKIAVLHAPLLALERDIVQRLLRRAQQIVEAVLLRTGVGQIPAAAHQRVECAWTLVTKRHEQAHDGVPGMRGTRANQVAADLALGIVGRLRTIPLALLVARKSRFEDTGVEHAHVARQRGDRQTLVHLRDHARGDRVALFHQRFEPRAEPRGVELLGAAGGGRAPQIEIEDGGDLLRRCGCDERAAGVDAVVTDHLMQNVRREPRDDVREVRCVEQARQGAGRLVGLSVETTRIDVLRHEPPMIEAAAAKKQS